MCLHADDGPRSLLIPTLVEETLTYSYYALNILQSPLDCLFQVLRASKSAISEYTVYAALIVFG